MSFVDLPEEVILYLSHFLTGRDVLNLSHTCSSFFGIFQSDHFWLQRFVRDALIRDSSIVRFARDLDLPCLEKTCYILHCRVKHNWRNARAKVTSIPVASSDHVRMGHDNRHLVMVDWSARKWVLKVWDIGKSGIELIIDNPHWTTELQTEVNFKFQLDLQTILVAKGVALLCFNGKGDDTPQELIACDLANNFTELWRDAIYDWGQFELTRLFGTDIYKFNLLANKIEVFDIRTYAKLFNIPLVEEIRYPHGDISGDGRHLAIPGKMAADNSPAVSVWNVRRGSQKFLYPTQSFCPFRWFEKTAVKKGKVYGLLNRRCMFIWDAETGRAINKVDLTNTVPGDAEPALTFTFLTVSSTLVATINLHPSGVTLFDSNGNLIPMIESALLMHQLMKTPCKVCDVLINEHCLFVRTVNFQNPEFQLAVFPFPLGANARETFAGAKRVELIPVEDCVVHELGITSTKLLNFAKHELRIYDFL